MSGASPDLPARPSGVMRFFPSFMLVLGLPVAYLGLAVAADVTMFQPRGLEGVGAFYLGVFVLPFAALMAIANFLAAQMWHRPSNWLRAASAAVAFANAAACAGVIVGILTF